MTPRAAPAVAKNATSGEPDRSVVRRLGGSSIVARHLGLHRTRVAAWPRPPSRGGTGGRIPQWHWPQLLAVAEARKVQLAPRELVQAQRPRTTGARP